MFGSAAFLVKLRHVHGILSSLAEIENLPLLLSFPKETFERNVESWDMIVETLAGHLHTFCIGRTDVEDRE